MHKKLVLACAAVVFATPFFVSAALTQDQINAILAILQSFGASQSVISNVQAALNGQGGTASSSPCVNLSYNLYAGKTDDSTNGEVTKLQQFLGITPATGYFGPITEQAVQRYQAAHSIVSSGSPDTSGYGFVGPQTRSSMSCSSSSSNQNNNNQNNNQNPGTTPTVTLTASPSSITSGDQAVTLSWTSANVSTCTGNYFNPPGTSGSTVVHTSQNLTYTITCSGPGGSVSSSATVTIGNQNQNPTVTLTSSASSVTAGQSATLTWSSTNATSCTGTGFTASGTSGSVSVSPTANTTYSLTCTGANGSASASTSVAVSTNQNTPTVTLTSSPAAITAGQSSILTWSSTNATSCTGTGFTANGTSGSVSVSPTANTTYSISCTGTNGSAQTSTSVTVTTQSTQPGTTGTNTIADVRHIIPAFNPALDAVAASTGFGTGKIWHVGPTEQYTSFRDIASQLGDGDIVEIDAATYGCHEQSIKWTAKNLTVVGVGGRPVFNATGCGIDGDKGIFNPQGTNMIIANIEFMGAAGGSGNDAGIRLDGGGYVYLTQDYFHDNQDGILITPYDPLIDKTLAPTNNMVIDHSEFARNGDGTGQTHNMYIGSGIDSFVLRFSYSHDSNVGHEVKSRAQKSYILYNRIASEVDGTESYSIDLPQGGLAYIIGNVIQKGPNAQNSQNIEFAWEGMTYPTIANAQQKLYVINNTIVNQHASTGNRYIIWLNDAGPSGFQDGKVANNIIVGTDATHLFNGDQNNAHMQTSNNVYMTNPTGFYDSDNRIYKLVAGSPAINAGADPGTAGGFSLTPKYQFELPHNDEVRPSSGALDAGAYEFDASQVIVPAPTVTLTASANPIAYNTAASLRWSTTNATYCTAGGGWAGSKPTSGSYTTAPLTANATYTISCTGPSGTVSATPLTVTVNDSAQADALGTYTWKDLSNTILNNFCPDSSKFPNTQGAFGCSGWALGATTPVYVPDTNKVYFMGGSGSYGYYGNEVYAFNLSTMQPERVTDPTLPSDTQEYNSSLTGYPYTPPYTLAACSRALHLKSGGVAMAANGTFGQAGWDPLTKKIIVGAGGYQRQSACSNSSNYATDLWSFDPVSKVWALLAGPSTVFDSTGQNSGWFIDPATGIAFAAPNGRTGNSLTDFGTTPPTTKVVNNNWPYSTSGPSAVDTTHSEALQLTSSGALVYDLNGLALSKYGTNGSGGSTGVVGGSGPLFTGASFTTNGDTTLLSALPETITYNPKLDMFVAPGSSGKTYFIKVDYANKAVNIISKQIAGAPTTIQNLIYIPSLNEYLAYTGMGSDFYLLVPPTSTAFNTTSTQSSQLAALGALTQTLALNSTGAQVNTLQEMLKRAGLFVGETTNFFGPKTQAAVELFQLHHGLEPVGIVGPMTRKALNALSL